MTRTIIALLLISACGDNWRDQTYGSIVSPPSVTDAAVDTILVDSEVVDSPIIDSSLPDAPLDATDFSCHSTITIDGTDNTNVFVSTIVTCPKDEDYQITTKVFNDRNVILVIFLQGNVTCSPESLITLRDSESKPISRVETSVKIIQTGETISCNQN